MVVYKVPPHSESSEADRELDLTTHGTTDGFI